MEIKTVDIGNITPFHQVRDQEKLGKLTENMKVNGWVGRPIVVLDIGYIHALTASHRIQAAINADLYEVQIAVVNHGNMFDEYDLGKDFKDPDQIYNILKKYDDEAAELFREDMD